MRHTARLISKNRDSQITCLMNWSLQELLRMERWPTWRLGWWDLWRRQCTLSIWYHWLIWVTITITFDSIYHYWKGWVNSNSGGKLHKKKKNPLYIWFLNSINESATAWKKNYVRSSLPPKAVHQGEKSKVEFWLNSKRILACSFWSLHKTYHYVIKL